MLHTEAVSHLLAGEPELADPILANAVHHAARAGALPLASLALAERCVVAAQRDDWTVVDGYVDRAVSIVQDGHFDDVLDQRAGLRVGRPGRAAPG